jgi:hypothetical protein
LAFNGQVADRSVAIPCLLYIADRHTGELLVASDTPVYAALLSAQDRSLARAASAAFVVCFTLISLGYLIGIGKSTVLPVKCVRYLGFPFSSPFSRWTRKCVKRCADATTVCA